MPQPLPIRVVVVTMYETAVAGGTHFGEFRLWAEGLPLAGPVAFPCGLHDLCINQEMAVLGIVTGVGTARAAASIMALGLDPRFDLTRAYWLIAGIAGINPEAGSLGSAVWVERVVDADLAYEIDAREIPADWQTGFLPLGRTRPYEAPADAGAAGSIHRLDPAMVAWAHRLTAGLRLDDTAGMQQARAPYVDFPAARLPPAVRRGDEVSASTFWHGALLNRHAAEWMRYWTGGSGHFVVSAMEETGTLEALAMLARAGRVEWRRILVLRTASNYTMPPPGMTAAQSLTAASLSRLPGYRPALDAAYRVGRTVVDEIVGNWGAYAEAAPVAPSEEDAACS